MALKMGFIMDPPEELVLYKDVSCLLMRESILRGHEVHFIYHYDVFVEDAEPQARSYKPIFDGFALSLEDMGLVRLRDFDVILNRKDPPFDMNYIYLTYMLDLVKKDVFVMNDPHGLRSANEKFYSLHFPEFIPDTLIAKKKDKILGFLEKHAESGIVLKPLDNRGGQGVVFLKKGDWNRGELIRMLTENETTYIVAQQFIQDEKRRGDKRIVVLDGEPIISFARIPSDDDFRANIVAGARSEPEAITDREMEICEKLKPFLKEQGLYLVGLDLIAGFITEINVTSVGANKEPDYDLWIKVIDFIEKKVSR